MSSEIPTAILIDNMYDVENTYLLRISIIPLVKLSPLIKEVPKQLLRKVISYARVGERVPLDQIT